jgi:hypothetical protein
MTDFWNSKRSWAYNRWRGYWLGSRGDRGGKRLNERSFRKDGESGDCLRSGNRRRHMRNG